MSKVFSALERLMTDYLATLSSVESVAHLTGTPAHEVATSDIGESIGEAIGEATSESIGESKRLVQELWAPLENQLRVPAGHVADYWIAIGPGRQEGIFMNCLMKRIETLSANRVFTSQTAERVSNKALTRLEEMMDRREIRNVGELMALAKMSQGSNQSTPPSGGMSVTINGMRLADGQSLPGNDQVMMISLSPHMAENIQQGVIRPNERVIDAEMVGIQDLRDFGVRQKQATEEA